MPTVGGVPTPGPLLQSAPPPHQAGRPRSMAGGPWAERGPGRRHRPASVPERAGAAPDRVPDRVPQRPVERPVGQQPGEPVERPVEQQVGQSVEAGQTVLGADPVPPDTTGAGPAEDGAASEGAALAAGQSAPQTVAAVPLVVPARWVDASTRQLPLGAGLGLIGCGLGLIGLRLRKG
ncbi:hypothetical protein ACF9IK_17865 [Kitasatospora hibisci]|uniref:hypothetical protein n=1 Tax=Kitasatospora hibisci TaxID=3369522 RepID=UPI0037548245